MSTRFWLCAALVLTSATASANCPKCQCMSALEGADDPVPPNDVALNARLITGVPDLSRKERYVLRPVGGEPISVKAVKLHVDTSDMIVLTPTAPLTKNTDYELVLLRGAETIPYSKFHTADTTDSTPPTWEGPLKAEFSPSDDCDVECNSRRGPRVEIRGPVPSDDRSGIELVAIWLTDGAPINYARPATAQLTILPSDTSPFLLGPPASSYSSVTIVLGGPGPCTQQSVPLPRGAKNLRVGMKVLDRAGNASAPRELEVKLAALRAK